MSQESLGRRAGQAETGRMQVFTDGGCSGNPGPGAWAYIVLGDGRRLQGAGGQPRTTNNRMELTAVIEALKRIRQELPDRRAALDLHTDSRYVQRGITEWILKWERNGWRSSTRAPVKNQDLWQELRRLTASMEIRWHWLAGHRGHPYNEECDRMVQAEIRRLRG